MRHTKLIVLGIVLVLAAIFAFLFWDKLYYNQQDIANTPTGDEQSEIVVPKAEVMSSSDELSDLEADVNATSTTELDADLGDLEAELSGL